LGTWVVAGGSMVQLQGALDWMAEAATEAGSYDAKWVRTQVGIE